MNDHDQFLRAIFDNPGDDGPRLVYADWLEEQGNKSGPVIREKGRWRFLLVESGHYYLVWERNPPPADGPRGVFIHGVVIHGDDVKGRCRACGTKECVLNRDGDWECAHCRRLVSERPPLPWYADRPPPKTAWNPEGGRVRALSLWQPWASLVVYGQKRIETRSWRTDFRGRFLVHAAKRWQADQSIVVNDFDWVNYLSRSALAQAIVNAAAVAPNADIVFNEKRSRVLDMPRGVLLGSVELVDCIEVLDHTRCVSVPRPGGVRTYRIPPYSPESGLGDYTVGRYAWLLANPVAFRRPVPYRGGRGWFKVPVSAFEEDE